MPNFTFKGISSDSMGVVVLDYPPIIKASARVTLTQIPGRSGTDPAIARKGF